MREAVIVSAVRTPVGKARGTLASVPAHVLGGLVVKEAVRRSGVEPKEIDDVIFGNLMANEIANMGRVVALEAGLPLSVPGITIDRQCASSLNAFVYAAMMVEGGHADVVVAGGAESDSRRCYVMEKPTTAYQTLPPKWADVRTAPSDELNVPMGITAENVAERYEISRRECDDFAVDSHRKAAFAWQAGKFRDQIVPVEVEIGKGKTALADKDEVVRPGTTAEILARLKPAFKPDGIVTAGNSSPLSDGAAALVVMDRGRAKSLGLPILARFSSFATVGVDPRYMGLGPIAATEKLFKRTGMTMGDIDLVELNEAFAAQSIACVRDLAIDEQKLNVNGGAIALGHPLAGTGAILLTKMVYELEARNATSGLITFCVGGGMGMSAVIERV